MLFRSLQDKFDALMRESLIHAWMRFFSALVLVLTCLVLFSCGDAGSRPWPSHPISISADTVETIQTIALIDLNQDGHPEVLASRENSDAIDIYAYTRSGDGQIHWTQHQITAVAGIQQFHLWQTGTRSQPEYALVVASGQPTMRVLSSPLPTADQAFEPSAWDFSELPVPAGNWSAVDSADFNNDGINDLALAGRADTTDRSSAPEIIWMSNPLTNERTVVKIGASAAPLLVFADDVEEDGDIDLLVVDSASGSGSMGAYWLENPWPEDPAVEWKRNFITLSSLKPIGASVVDLDADQQMDLLMCLQENSTTDRLMCFKKVSAATEVAWLPLPLPVSGRLGSLRQANMTDVDQDGFNDLVLGYTDASDPLEHLLWLRNPTSEASSPAWLRKPLSGSSGGISTQGILLLDVDGDGDSDLISAEAGGALRWYENPVPSASP